MYTLTVNYGYLYKRTKIRAVRAKPCRHGIDMYMHLDNRNEPQLNQSMAELANFATITSEYAIEKRKAYYCDNLDIPHTTVSRHSWSRIKNSLHKSNH